MDLRSVASESSERSPDLDSRLRECEVCGNAYDKPLEVALDGTTHVYDCFECAIHALAPACAYCGCKIIGHGAEADGVMYCSAHCAKAVGVAGLDDRV